MHQRLSAQCCLVLALATLGSTASAQTWSERRQRPALFEIVQVDETGEAAWPFGSEDLANDGAATLMADEAAVDLRSVYADARDGKLWLRAYVAATSAPSMTIAVAFFFIDTDASAATGGRPDVSDLWMQAELPTDVRGFERAVGIRGDGSLIGVYAWNQAANQWTQQPERPVLAEVETGLARDPLRLAGDDHGYLQVELDLPAFELDEACDGTIFVRTLNQGMGLRRFYDYALPADCRVRLDADGRPEFLVDVRCDDDSVCAARGSCESDRCVFDYECTQASECREGQRCTGGVCVGTAAGSGGRSGSGGTGGGAGARGAAGAGGSRGSAGEDDGAIEGEQVRGGALTCSAPPRSGSSGAGAAVAGVLFAAILLRARRRGGR